MQAGKMGDPRVKMTVMSKKGRQFLMRTGTDGDR